MGRVKRKITMDNIENYLPLIIGVGIPTITLIGKGIQKIFEHVKNMVELRNESEKLKLDDERLDIEKVATDASVASNLADVLKKVVNPLAERISMLESDAIKRQEQINALNETVFDLKRTIHLKDIELDRLRVDYNNQLIITAEQEKKINEQSVRIEEQDKRIVELETKIKNMKQQEGKQ